MPTFQLSQLGNMIIYWKSTIVVLSLASLAANFCVLLNFQITLFQTLSSRQRIPIPENCTTNNAAAALQEALAFVHSLRGSERRVFSQNLEDGVTAAIFDKIGARHKYFVEFGVEAGDQCNTRYFREHLGWNGLMMDGGNFRPEINLQQEKVFPNNVVSLFEKYQVPKHFDLFSEDTDFKDFWLIRNVLEAGYRPRVIISEVNTFHGGTKSWTVPLDFPQQRWDMSTQYFGYTPKAAWHLGRKYGYSLIYCDSEGVNCFYVIDGAEGFGEGFRLSDHISSESIWEYPPRLPHLKDWSRRPYTTITEDNF